MRPENPEGCVVADYATEAPLEKVDEVEVALWWCKDQQRYGELAVEADRLPALMHEVKV